MIKAGVMGDPVSHSLSPKLHSAWLKRYDIDGSYEALHVVSDQLEAELRALKANGFAGVNLTIPHKEAALAFVDEISPSAKAIGAINTIIVKDDGSLYGDNTDGIGFIDSLKQGAGGLSPYLEHCFILGAGGAAKAVHYALQQAGARRISISNRNRIRAESYDAVVIDWEDKSSALANVSLLINTTSLGMKGQPALDISLEKLPNEALVTDIVYQPLMTPLLKEAQNRGNPNVTGIGMLIHQAAPGFEAWFGKKPEVDEEIHAILQKALS